MWKSIIHFPQIIINDLFSLQCWSEHLHVSIATPQYYRDYFLIPLCFGSSFSPNQLSSSTSFNLKILSCVFSHQFTLLYAHYWPK